MELMGDLPRDPRLKGLLFEYPSVMLGIVCTYIAFSLKFGPDFMRSRTPYNVGAAKRVYYVVQIITNMWFAYHAIEFTWRHWHDDRLAGLCGPAMVLRPEFEHREAVDQLLVVCLFYFYTRFVDLGGTLLYIFAKELSRVSFMHVYHHAIVAFTGYVYLRSGWSHTLFYGSIANSIVHVAMYTYFTLANFPLIKPYLRWKRYLTLVQILQFAFIGFQMVAGVRKGCGCPSTVLYFNLSQVFVFIVLFSRFYLKKNTDRTDATAENSRQSKELKRN
ncbi:elongation of very long chain fatty acids protein 2-like [Tropilaelaps mercedesae]|uniref:Elongation of very long chain fatty acids protein n=1 Tax=Tropilaelaps mercedesae TaxID=418985 RepID=A0A1V9XN30_9ACAR|nr:elongation of very long chain fatty acids protein 2-like [Tropilaelaps mercedesae]